MNSTRRNGGNGKGRRPKPTLRQLIKDLGFRGASVFTREDNGRLVARVTMADGSYRYLYGQDQTELVQRATRLAQGRETLAPADPGQITVADYLRDWLITLPSLVTSGKLKASTADYYRRYLERHVLSDEMARKPIGKLEPEDLQALYARKLADPLTGGDGLSPTTVHHLHAIIHRALSRAQRLKLTPRNAAAEVDRDDRPKQADTEMRYLGGRDLQRFLHRVRGERLEAMLVVAVMEGLRQGELLGLRWKDVDLGRGTLAVVGSLSGVNTASRTIAAPKTKRSRRHLDLFPESIKALTRHHERQSVERERVGSLWLREIPVGPRREPQPNDLVFTTEFGGFLSTTTLTRTLDRLLRDAGLPDIRWHDLRHSAATHWFQNGMHVKIASERLGHSSVAITLDRYSHVIPGMQQDAVAKVSAASRAAREEEWPIDVN